MKHKALVVAAAGVVACAPLLASLPVPAHTERSSRQAVVERRGQEVMPFDLNRTMHVFAPTLDGGVQTVLVHDGDPEQIALVRAHLKKEATAFARGDFADPAAIHGMKMPGLAQLRAGAARLTVSYADTPNGARITYKTADPKLVAAIHDWFAAQVEDHGAQAMMSHAAQAVALRDGAFASDMRIVHELLADHTKITRSVTKLANGIRTVTESDDPQVAAYVKAHVASMRERLKEGKTFNVASHTLPTIFAHSDTIRTEVQQTPKGVIVTQTSTDPATIAALQAHAAEVSDLVQEGMVALMRQVMANGGPISPSGSGQPGRMARGMMRGMMAPGAGMANHGGGPPMMAHMMQLMMGGGEPPQSRGPSRSEPPVERTP